MCTFFFYYWLLNNTYQYLRTIFDAGIWTCIRTIAATWNENALSPVLSLWLKPFYFVSLSSAQGLLLSRWCSRTLLVKLKGPFLEPRVEPKSAMCKARTFTTIFSLASTFKESSLVIMELRVQEGRNGRNFTNALLQSTFFKAHIQRCLRLTAFFVLRNHHWRAQEIIWNAGY